MLGRAVPSQQQRCAHAACAGFSPASALRVRRSCAARRGGHGTVHRAAAVETVAGACYEDIIDALARRATGLATAAAAAAASDGSSGRVVIGVAGAPGSGKSTLATAVAARTNELHAAQKQQQQQQKGGATYGATPSPYAVVLPMDGFHYYRRELDAMPDPKEAHARRGAPWTFDAAKFVAAVAAVRAAGVAAASSSSGSSGSGGTSDETSGCSRSTRTSSSSGSSSSGSSSSGSSGGVCGVVYVPSFDHGVGDPVEGDIAIPPSAAVVLVEGNYVLLDSEPWSQLRALFDEAWFVDCPLDLAMQRVFERQTGIGLAPEVSRVRIATNDRPNGELVAASARRATLLVPSTVPFRGRA